MLIHIVQECIPSSIPRFFCCLISSYSSIVGSLVFCNNRLEIFKRSSISLQVLPIIIQSSGRPFNIVFIHLVLGSLDIRYQQVKSILIRHNRLEYSISKEVTFDFNILGFNTVCRDKLYHFTFVIEAACPVVIFVNETINVNPIVRNINDERIKVAIWIINNLGVCIPPCICCCAKLFCALSSND